MFLYKHFVRGPETNLLDDIIRNINFVLNTKRGYGYFLRDVRPERYRLSNHRGDDHACLERAQENLRLYEPRVEVSGIDEVYEEGKRPRLVVSLRLRGHDEKLELVVDMGARSFDIHRVEPKEPQ